MEKMLKDKKVIALFILPALVLFAMFIPVPLVTSLGLSLFKWDLLSAPRFIGLRNFTRMVTLDTIFLKSVGNTFRYLIYSILLQIPLAYFLAILLTRGTKGEKIFRNLIFMPVILSGTAVALMFYFIYHRDSGLINNLIRLFGNKEFAYAWLAEERTALIAVCISIAWQFVGYHMVIFITGITGISNDILEASKIDGANIWQMTWFIITPLMKPVLNVSLVLITTSSLKAFDSIFVMTQGGPLHATEVMASYMFERAFHHLDYGYGCAISLVLFVLCVVFTSIISKIFTKREAGETIE